MGITKNKFITDNGRIRRCDSNIRKMTVMEYIRFDLSSNILKKRFGISFIGVVKDMIVGLTVSMFEIILLIIIISTFPVSIPLTLYIRAKRAIRRAIRGAK